MHNHSGTAKTNAAHRIIKEGAKPVTFTHGAHPATSTTHSNVVVPLLPPMPLTGTHLSHVYPFSLLLIYSLTRK